MLLARRAPILEVVLFALGTTLLLLTVTSPSAAVVDHEKLLRDRLGEVRELLGRRQAHREMLSEQVGVWSLELDQLHLERKAALIALSEQVDLARGYEIELDRLMPRLLPRLARLEVLRKQGARTIAELASIGRDSYAEVRTKARFLATSKVSIDQMRRASTAVRLLRRVPNSIVGKHRDIDFQIPLLAGTVDRVSSKQEGLQRRRDNAFRTIASLSGDIERLTAEEHRLARNMLARTLTATTRLSRDNLDHAQGAFDRRDVGKAKIGDADIKSAAVRKAHPRFATRALDNVISRTSPPAKSMVPAMPGGLVAGKASAAIASWVNRGATKKLDSHRLSDEKAVVTVLQAGPFNSISSRVDRGQIQESHPLVPTRETIGYTLADVLRQADQPAIEIPASSRQRVAAPDDGLVVFASYFRSYGLLLIIEHDSEYHTLLWGFSSLDIELGDHIRAGQIVGTVGMGRSPKLHVELRRNGEPVSPEVWLAASNSGIKG